MNGQEGNAIADLNQTILLDPRLAPGVLHYRGSYFASRGDHDKAIADFSEAIRLNPTQPIFYVSRARAY